MQSKLFKTIFQFNTLLFKTTFPQYMLISQTYCLKKINALVSTHQGRMKIFSKFGVAHWMYQHYGCHIVKEGNFVKHEDCVGYLVTQRILSCVYVVKKSARYSYRVIYSLIYHSLIIRNGMKLNLVTVIYNVGCPHSELTRP